jgi:predicted nucleic acid-binding protein
VKLVVDASTLVAELVRARGRRLFERPDLQLMVSQHAWVEARRHLAHRATELKKRLDPGAVDELIESAHDLVDRQFVVVPVNLYSSHEGIARKRVRDETDWPTVALALTTQSAILTNDPDFLGSGIATWTYDTLAAELERQDG